MRLQLCVRRVHRRGVLTVRAETADSVTADSSTADSSAADSAVDEQEQIRHGDMDENTGAEEDVDVNQGG